MYVYFCSYKIVKGEGKMRKDRLTKHLSSILLIMIIWTSLFTPLSIQHIEAAENQDLVITEIMPDNTGADNYEFFEIHNKSDQPINLANYKFSYIYTDGSGKPVSLIIPEQTIDPKQTLVFWYNNSGKSKVEFLNHYGADIQSESVLEFSGFSGFSNGGNRGNLDSRPKWK